MNQRQWNKWRKLPETTDFFKFLADYREYLGKEIASSIMGGVQVEHAFTDEAALRCELYHDLESLDYSYIGNFYKEIIINKSEAA